MNKGSVHLPMTFSSSEMPMLLPLMMVHLGKFGSRRQLCYCGRRPGRGQQSGRRGGSARRPGRYHLDRRIGQVDVAVEKTAERGRGKAAMALADAQSKNRAELVATRTSEAGKLANLKVEMAAIDGERKAVEAGPGI
jgi:hypothetical protein